MAQSPKPTHQLQSLVLIPSIIRPFDKSFRLKVPTTTELSIPLMLLAQMNLFYHLPTLSFPPFILLPLKFRTVEFSISVTCLDIPIVPSHLFVLTPLGPYAPLVPLLGEAPQGLVGLNSPWLKPTINPDYTELHLLTLVHFSTFYTRFTIVESKSFSSTKMINWYNALNNYMPFFLWLKIEKRGNTLLQKSNKSRLSKLTL